MHLWLLRHGKAEDRDRWSDDDALRPLTKAGISHARRVLGLLDAWVVASEIWTSPFLRARQTAEIAAAEWKLPLREQAWLAAEVVDAATVAAHLDPERDLILVGHEPDLGRLAGWLTGGNPIPLKKAGLCHLAGEPVAGGMELQALLAPKLILGLAGDA
jgi:phosphohistidine phosphatase